MPALTGIYNGSLRLLSSRPVVSPSAGFSMLALQLAIAHEQTFQWSDGDRTLGSDKPVARWDPRNNPKSGENSDWSARRAARAQKLATKRTASAKMQASPMGAEPMREHSGTNNILFDESKGKENFVSSCICRNKNKTISASIHVVSRLASRANLLPAVSFTLPLISA